jgi:hypothetical protein
MGKTDTHALCKKYIIQKIVGKPLRNLVKFRRRWEENMKTDLRERGHEDVSWVYWPAEGLSGCQGGT